MKMTPHVQAVLERYRGHDNIKVAGSLLVEAAILIWHSDVDFNESQYKTIKKFMQQSQEFKRFLSTLQ